VVAGIQQGWLEHKVKVHTHGGMLTIEWQGAGASVMMSGPATTVFTGEMEIPE
jgi:diaminopimelate epimerase